MRKIFSFLAAVLFAGSMMAAYTVQQVSSVKAGGKYIFERNDRVLIGTVSSSKLQTTSDYQSLNGDENYIWTLETANGGFYLKQGEKYLKNSSSSSVSLVASGGSVWKFEFTDGVALISNVSNNDRYIGETVEGSNEYKAYSTQNMTYGHDFTVYEVVEGEGGGGGETPKVVDIIFPAKSNVCYTDMVDDPDEGWWQFQAEDSEYYITLSNSNTITKAAGTYTVAQLDAEYSYIYHDDKEIAFKSGSLTLKEENGQVSIAGTLQAKDGKTYNISLVYVEPVAEKTVNIVIHGAELDPDDPEAMEAFILTGTAANNDYVQIVLASEQIVGEYDESHIVEDEYYPETMVMIDEEPYWIYTASIKVEKLAAEGEYKVLADLLCYNSVLYKVDMTVGDEQTGLDALGTAVKALKRIVNGNLVIERAGKAFNVQGAQIR